jgi:cell division ATPase FtsA
MNFLHRFRPQKSSKPMSVSLVDIGRDTVKALVILVVPNTNEPQIVGYGLAETDGHDVAGGRLEAAAVTNPVNAALTQAEDSTEKMIGQKIVPDDVIFALPGRATRGELFTIRQSRPDASKSVTVKEITRLNTRVERVARQKLSELPVERGQWQALAVTDAGIRLDGRLVLDGVGLNGQELALSVFGVAGQAGALRALELLATRLDLRIENVVASWHALALTVPYAEAIVLDVGFSGTDICLVRDGALVAAGWFPIGGEFFTLALVQALNISRRHALDLKHAWGDGVLSEEEADQVDVWLEKAQYRWYKTVMQLLAKFSAQRPLPWKIYLTGGGSLLPGLARFLRADPRPFVRAPELGRLGQLSPVRIRDLTDGLDKNLFSLAASLTVGLPA